MEKRLPLKNLAICLTLFFAANGLFALPASKTDIHISLWALVDAYPGSLEAAQTFDNYSYPVKKIKEVAPFFIEGMVYGWNFVYTPLDVRRSVAEFFEFEPSRLLTADETKRIQYAKPWEENNRLYCWINFPLTQHMIVMKQQWDSVEYRRVRGKGFAPLELGFEGIQKAASEALKNAVREYARGMTKNKPKELVGRVLLVNTPVLSVDAGRYKIELDFFIELSTIIPYNLY